MFSTVAGGVLELLGFSRAALVDENQPVVTGQRDQVRQEIIVGSPGSAMHDQERRALAERLVVNQHAARIYVAFFGLVARRMRRQRNR
jgi:hypothetical protein